jgi:hypothetical protein
MLSSFIFGLISSHGYYVLAITFHDLHVPQSNVAAWKTSIRMEFIGQREAFKLIILNCKLQIPSRVEPMRPSPPHGLSPGRCDSFSRTVLTRTQIVEKNLYVGDEKGCVPCEGHRPGNMNNGSFVEERRIGSISGRDFAVLCLRRRISRMTRV